MDIKPVDNNIALISIKQAITADKKISDDAAAKTQAIAVAEERVKRMEGIEKNVAMANIDSASNFIDLSNIKFLQFHKLKDYDKTAKMVARNISIYDTSGGRN